MGSRQEPCRRVLPWALQAEAGAGNAGGEFMNLLQKTIGPNSIVGSVRAPAGLPLLIFCQGRLGARLQTRAFRSEEDRDLVEEVRREVSERIRDAQSKVRHLGRREDCTVLCW